MPKHLFLISTFLVVYIITKAQLYVPIGENITVSTTGDLNLQEDLNNNGTITDLTLGGSNTNAISGTGSIGTLIVNNKGAFTATAGMQTITGLLTPIAGTLSAAGYVTLKSDINKTAYATSGAAIIRGLNIQHYLTSTQRGWNVIGNPFTTNVSLSSLATASNIDVTYIDIPNSYGGNSGASSKTYSSAADAWTAISYGGCWESETPVALFIRGIKGEGIQGSAGAGWISGIDYLGGAGTPSHVTLSAQGNLNVAAANITLIANKPNIVTNPFGAPISLTAVMAANAGLASPIGYYLPVKGSIGVKLNSGGYEIAIPSAGADVLIPPMGSFVVTSTSATSINIAPAAISLLSPAIGSNGSGGLPNSVALKVTSETGIYYDKLNIVFDSKATDTIGDRYDFIKLANENFDLYSLSTNHTKLAFDNRKFITEDLIIHLGIRSVQTGTYQFELLDNHLPIGTKVYLKDNYLHTQTQLREGSRSFFKVQSDTLSQGEKRFVLIFSNKNTGLVPGALSADILGDVTSNNTIAVKISGNYGPVIINMFDVVGRYLGTVNATEGTQQIHMGNYGSGVLLFEFINANTRIIKKLMKQ